jgi:hypothetical protein
MLRELESIDWNTIIMNSHNLDEITLKFYEIIWPKFDKSFFPLIKVRTSSRDPPFMSPLVNHLLNQRKTAIQNGNTEANTRLQEKINKLIRENQLNAVKQEFGNQKIGSKSWRSNVNSITSRKKKHDVSVSASLNPREINKYFQSVNTEPNYTTPEPLQISEGTRIPSCQFMKFNIFY